MANQTQILNVSDEMKFDDNVQTDNVKEQEENMYSSSSDTTEELCSFRATDTCGDSGIAPKEKWLEILDFTYFSRKIIFSQSERKDKKKAILNGVSVSVVLSLETGTPKN